MAGEKRAVRARFNSMALLAGLLVGTPFAASSTATLTGLGDLPGGPISSSASAVSADGSTVVGWSRSSDVSGNQEAFRWTETTGMVGLGDFGAAVVRSQAHDVSADGSVIVGQGRAGHAFLLRPFRWSASTGMIAVDAGSSVFDGGQAFGVSADGSVIVGVGRTSLGNLAFRWSAAGGMVGLGWLPSDTRDSFAFDVSADGGAICGISSSGDAGGVEPFVWSEARGLTGLGDVPGGMFYAIAWAISANGSTVGGAARTTFGSNDEAFLWSESDGFVRPDTLHGMGFTNTFEAVTGDGRIAVGSSWIGAVVWDATNGLRFLEDVLVTDFGLDLAGWRLWSANDITPDGRVLVGTGTNPAGMGEAWIVRLPDSITRAAYPGAAAGRGATTITLRGAHPVRSGAAFQLRTPSRGDVRVTVHAANGRRVRALFEGVIAGDFHDLDWNGRDDGGRNAAPGVYFVTAESSQGSAAIKFVLTR